MHPSYVYMSNSEILASLGHCLETRGRITESLTAGLANLGG